MAICCPVLPAENDQAPVDAGTVCTAGWLEKWH